MTGSARPNKLLCYEDYNMVSCNCRVLRMFCISCNLNITRFHRKILSFGFFCKIRRSDNSESAFREGAR